VGKQADLVALDMNIFQMNKAEINRASVVFTMFNGNVVFDPTGIAGTAVGSPAPPPSASTSRIRSSFGLVLSGIGAILLCFL
jgi:hypothetical protein